MSAPNDLDPVASTDRYRVIAKLAEGATSDVYLADDLDLRRRVAIKVLRPDLDVERHAERVARFHRQRDAMARLDHPNLVTIFGADAAADREYFVMSWVDGETGATWLQSAPRTPEQIIAVFIAAGRGLAAAHARKVAHGNFTAAKLLVGRDGCVRVIGLLDEGDAHADQRGFCAALRAALAGKSLPRSLRTALDRGMSAAREARFASMNALLAALEPKPSRYWIPICFGATLAIARVSAPVLFGHGESPCRADAQWATVWNPARASAVEAAFAATHTPYAAHAAERVRIALDAYRQRWVHTYAIACEDARGRGLPPDEALDSRIICLDGRLRRVGALVEGFASATADLVERAPRAVAELDDLVGCTDSEALARRVPLPGDAKTRAGVAALQSALAKTTTALLARPASDQARPQLQDLLTAARATRYRPLEAEVLLALGSLEQALGAFAPATDAYEKARLAAVAGRDHRLEARAWIAQMNVSGRAGREQEGLRMLPLVTRRIARLHGDDELAGLSRLETSRLLLGLERFAEGGAEAVEAMHLFERRFGPDDPRVADTLVSMGRAAQLESAAKARSHYEHALRIRQHAYGAAHPEVAVALDMIARTYFLESRYADSIATSERAIAIMEHARGPQHASLGPMLHIMSLALRNERTWRRAFEINERAIQIGEAAWGRDHPDRASRLVTRASLLTELGRYEDAESALCEALGIFEQSDKPKFARIGLARQHLAVLENRRGRFARGREAAERSIAATEKVFGAETSELSPALLALGEAELGLGHPARALVALERAATLPDLHARADAHELALLDFALARALTMSGTQIPRARVLARSAEARARATHDLALTRTIERWRARHR